jgi:putative transposase
MSRPPRIDLGNQVYHVINRTNTKATIFRNTAEYVLFEQTLAQAIEKNQMPVLAYCVMPNHVHLVLHPQQDSQMSRFMHWLTTTFTRRWHTAHNTVGTGHVFQGRYKSFLVDTNSYLLQLLLYVERNPLRSKLVERAEDWRWSSLWIRENAKMEQKVKLSEWPIEIPKNYIELVNGV